MRECWGKCSLKPNTMVHTQPSVEQWGLSEPGSKVTKAFCLSLTIGFISIRPNYLYETFWWHEMSWGLHFQNSHWFWWAELLLIKAKKDFQKDFVWAFLHHPQREEGDALRLHAWHNILLSILSGDMVWTVRYWDLILHFAQNLVCGPFNAQMSILHSVYAHNFYLIACQNDCYVN